MKIENRKGAMIPEWVVVVIVLVVCFAIVFFLYTQINWKGTIDKDSCRESALLRATTPSFQDQKILDLPLRCQTEKICIASSWYAGLPVVGGCEQFRGEKNVKIVKVDNRDKVKELDEINQILADSLYDCWWMFYFGKNNLFSRSAWKDQNYCAVCSRIAFDKGVQKDFSQFSGLEAYMKKTLFPRSDKTYFQTIFGELSSFQDAGKNDMTIDTSKQYSVVYAFLEPNDFARKAVEIAGLGASGIAASLPGKIPYVGWIIGPSIGKGIMMAGAYASLMSGEAIDKYLNDNLKGEKVDNDLFGDEYKGFYISEGLREYSVQDLGKCSDIITIP